MLRRHARSFSWAARLLPARVRADATALYAWCRRCDDAVDLAPDAAEARANLSRLRDELDEVYGPRDLADPILAGFQDVVRRTQLPRGPCDELLAGMEMDLGHVRYASFDELLIYCFRVAGTVGLMMAHLIGVRDAATLATAVRPRHGHAAHQHLPRRRRRRASRPRLPTRRAAGRRAASDGRGSRHGARRGRAPAAGGRLLPARATAASPHCLLAVARGHARGAPHLRRRSAGVIARRGYDVSRGRAVVSRCAQALARRSARSLDDRGDWRLVSRRGSRA